MCNIYLERTKYMILTGTIKNNLYLTLLILHITTNTHSQKHVNCWKTHLKRIIKWYLYELDSKMLYVTKETNYFTFITEFIANNGMDTKNQSLVNKIIDILIKTCQNLCTNLHSERWKPITSCKQHICWIISISLMICKNIIITVSLPIN